MMMLYAVRMRLVFISSVTAMTPLRTISVITGSASRGFKRFVVLLGMTRRVGIARSRVSFAAAAA